MKFAYCSILGNVDASSNSGVVKKTLNQFQAFKNIPNLNFFPIIIVTSGDILSIKKKFRCVNPYILDLSDSSKFTLQFNIWKDVNKLIEVLKPDVLYLRYPLSNLPFYFFLMQLKKEGVLIAQERQSIEIKELNSHNNLFSKIKLLREYVFRRMVAKKTDIFFSVTKEISDYIIRYYPEAKCSVIGNGINCANANIENISENINKAIEIVFIGNITPWTGLDIIINDLDKMGFIVDGHEIFLRIIGEGVSFGKLLRIVSTLKNKKNVIIEGHVDSKNLSSFIQNSDIGMASLESRKRGLREGANLKLREYFCHELPFFKLDYDPDFDDSEDISNLFLNISTCQKDDYLSEIVQFVLNYKKNLIFNRKLIKSYTSSNLSWEKKCLDIIKKIESL